MPKVLIAIKSELLCQRLAASLTEYDLQLCHTGGEALRQMECLQPDVLLLDLGLPDMGGLTVLQTSPFKPRIVLAFADYADDAVLTQAAELGVQSVILLPCSARYVRALLEALTENALLAD